MRYNLVSHPVDQTGILRLRDPAAHGIPREHLRRLAQAGRLERIERGLYLLPNADQTEHHTFAEVTGKCPEVSTVFALKYWTVANLAPTILIAF